jgi:hypothetical protein
VLIERTQNEVLPLAACLELSENSRLGFASKVTAQEPGLLFVNSQSTLGMHVSLRETRGGSRIQTWNRYAYVTNNPLSNIDLLGLKCQPGALPTGAVHNKKHYQTTSQWTFFGGCGATDAGFIGGWGGDDMFYSPTGEDQYTVFWGFTLSNVLNDQYPAGQRPANPTPAANNCTPGTTGCFNVPTQQQQQCVQAAYANANDAAQEKIWQNTFLPFKSAGAGAVSGGITGCVLTVEGGCFEGAIPGALTGFFGGAMEGIIQAVYSDVTGYQQVMTQLNNDLAGCQ